MADQEFLASFAVDIDEAGVVRLQTILSDNRDLANEVSGKRIGAVLEPIVLIVLLLICTGYLVDGSFSPFLYFRF